MSPVCALSFLGGLGHTSWRFAGGGYDAGERGGVVKRPASLTSARSAGSFGLLIRAFQITGFSQKGVADRRNPGIPIKNQAFLSLKSELLQKF